MAQLKVENADPATFRFSPAQYLAPLPLPPNALLLFLSTIQSDYRK
jgi:hypothetical protein